MGKSVKRIILLISMVYICLLGMALTALAADDQIEQIYIENAIRICGGSIDKAAKCLDINPSTIYRKKASWKNEGGNDLARRERLRALGN